MDYLSDNNLEELGLIKEINTIDIVNKANEIKEKRNNKILIISFILMMIIGFIGQVIFIVYFNSFKFIKIGTYIYIIVSVLLGLILVEKGEKSLC